MKLGSHHAISCGLGPGKKKKVSPSLEFIAWCFLTVYMMRPASTSTCCRGLPVMTDWNPNCKAKESLPSLRCFCQVFCCYRATTYTTSLFSLSWPQWITAAIFLLGGLPLWLLILLCLSYKLHTASKSGESDAFSLPHRSCGGYIFVSISASSSSRMSSCFFYEARTPDFCQWKASDCLISTAFRLAISNRQREKSNQTHDQIPRWCCQDPSLFETLEIDGTADSHGARVTAIWNCLFRSMGKLKTSCWPFGHLDPSLPLCGLSFSSLQSQGSLRVSSELTLQTEWHPDSSSYLNPWSQELKQSLLCDSFLYSLIYQDTLAIHLPIHTFRQYLLGLESPLDPALSFKGMHVSKRCSGS